MTAISAGDRPSEKPQVRSKPTESQMCFGPDNSKPTRPKMGHVPASRRTQSQSRTSKTQAGPWTNRAPYYNSCSPPLSAPTSQTRQSAQEDPSWTPPRTGWARYRIGAVGVRREELVDGAEHGEGFDEALEVDPEYRVSGGRRRRRRRGGTARRPRGGIDGMAEGGEEASVQGVELGGLVVGLPAHERGLAEVDGLFAPDDQAPDLVAELGGETEESSPGGILWC
ncbi:hypothetical protein PG997_002248 [Apiospora hydei]|uniref:Uncharacterized protein n=1 Tax=Apiospora hydei TaxID=1337664 RepID=A0ABR1X8W1_9PEZI